MELKEKEYGYMRVSSTDQNMASQHMELVRWGIEEKRLYADKVSGKDFDRPAYQIVRELGADIVILDKPVLDTRVMRDLVGPLISDIVLQLLSYVAQTEREYIRQRQREGIVAARTKRRSLGRPASPYPDGFDSCYEKWKSSIPTFSQVRLRLGVTENQLRWFIRRKNKEQI